MDIDDISSEDIILFLRRLGVSPVVVNIIFSALDTSRSTPCKLLGNHFFYRYSQHTSYTNHLVDIRQHKASMLSLPVEALERVVSFSDPKEVKNSAFDLQKTGRGCDQQLYRPLCQVSPPCNYHP